MIPNASESYIQEIPGMHLYPNFLSEAEEQMFIEEASKEKWIS